MVTSNMRGNAFNLSINVELPEQFFMDVMVTMVESGSFCVHYWGDISGVERDEELNVLKFKVTETEESGDNPMSNWVNPRAVAEAIERALNGEYEIGALIEDYLTSAVREADAGDIDAEASDVLAQLIVLGEVVYG